MQKQGDKLQVSERMQRNIDLDQINIQISHLLKQLYVRILSNN